jgi:DNA-binding CsgD family transcriptional regulator/PAS domain-containing protein
MAVHLDADALSDTIGSIYAAAQDSRLWLEVIERIRVLFDGSRACILRTGFDPRVDNCFVSPGEFDRIAVALEEFFDSYRVLEGRMAAVPLGLVYSDMALHGPEALHASRFWNAWMAPRDMYGGLGCRLVARGNSSWIFDVQRGRRQDPFGAEEVRLAGLVSRHLTRSLELSDALAAGRAAERTLDALDVGLLTIESDLTIRSINRAAEALLDAPNAPLRRRAGRLAVSAGQAGGRAAEALRRAVAQASPGRGGGLPGPGRDLVFGSGDEGEDEGERGALVVSVAPLGSLDGEGGAADHLALLALRRASRSPAPGFEAQMRLAFDLSPKEAWLAARLAAGLSLKEIAGEGDIALSTVRSYLEAVFAKTGTRRQGQLVSLAKSLEAPLGR